MYENVSVIHAHPVSLWQTNYVNRLLAGIDTCCLAHRIGDGFHLRRRRTLADYEVVGDGAVHLTKVSDYDVLSFLLLNTLDNCVNELVLCFHSDVC